MNYAKTVEANLNAMGTPASEWSAVGITRMVEDTDAPNGQPMPEFAFPEGYETAPTLYPTGPTADTMNCELCAHPIKNAFWLQNDARRWTLMVGSECVTHFGEGKSGVRLSKETVWAANRDLARQYVEAVRAFKAEWMLLNITRERSTLAFGAWHNVPRWGWKHNTPKAAMTACANLEELTKSLTPDDVVSPYSGRVTTEASANGTITRWMKNRQIADAWVETMAAAMPQKEVTQ